MKDFELAKAALTRSARMGLTNAEREYGALLAALREMEKEIGKAGIRFSLPIEDTPEFLDFQTPAGLLRMSKLLTVSGDYAVYSVFFTDGVDTGPERQIPDLWWLQLNWESPWKDSSGADLERDFRTDQTKSHLVVDAVLNAVAEKLRRNTQRLAAK
jgi:hypothetical protein